VDTQLVQTLGTKTYWAPLSNKLVRVSN